MKMSSLFEENLEALENIVKNLDEGDLTLDQALQSFEQGVALSRQCYKTLSDAEKKVEILLKEGGKTTGTTKFSHGEDE